MSEQINKKNSQKKDTDVYNHIFEDKPGFVLKKRAKYHLYTAAKWAVEKRAIQYSAFAFSGISLFLLGLIANALWGLNGQSGRNEGRLIELSSYIETLKSQNKSFESEIETLKKQRFCLIEKKKSTLECLYENR